MSPSTHRAPGPPEPSTALIVGAGLMGRWHAHAVRRIGGRVIGVMDPDPGRARALAERCNGAMAFHRLDHALAALTPTVVHVCSPSDSHEDSATAALDAGCHTVVEKPLARSAARTDRLLDRAAAVRRLLCPVHQLPFQPGTTRAAGLLRALGPVVHIDAWACSAGAAGQSPEASDEIAFEILPHPLSVLEYLMPGCLSRITWDVSRPAAGELRALGHDGTWSTALMVSMAGRPTLNAMRIIATNATLHLDFFHGYLVVERGSVSRGRKILRPFDLAARTLAAATLNLGRRTLRWEPAYPGLRELVSQFYRAARTGGSSPVPADATRRVASAADSFAAQLASAQRHPVIPIPEVR